MARIEEILELERLERDIFRGIIAETTLTRTFGGQVAGQALVSAVRTVDPAYSVHSLHGYFLRPGNPMEPTVFLVDRVRDGSIVRDPLGHRNSRRASHFHDVGVLPRPRRRHRAPGRDATRS